VGRCLGLTNTSLSLLSHNALSPQTLSLSLTLLSAFTLSHTLSHSRTHSLSLAQGVRVGGCFGLTNTFARSFGGWMSDYAYKKCSVPHPLSHVFGAHSVPLLSFLSLSRTLTHSLSTSTIHHTRASQMPFTHFLSSLFSLLSRALKHTSLSNVGGSGRCSS